jgi:hypothetical protein
MIWDPNSIAWFLKSILCRVSHFWSYANSIEIAILLVIVYDVVWHRLNAIRDVKRDEDAEKRTIQREEALERRQIQRERNEFIRKHWQELQYNLIALNSVATQMVQHRRFILEKKDSQDATTKQTLMMITKRLPEVISEFDDRWGRVASQLNVFPQPRDVLALEVLTVVLELGKTAGDKQIEIKSETLSALAKLVTRVADKGTLPNVDD